MSGSAKCMHEVQNSYHSVELIASTYFVIHEILCCNWSVVHMRSHGIHMRSHGIHLNHRIIVRLCGAE